MQNGKYLLICRTLKTNKKRRNSQINHNTGGSDGIRLQ